MIYECDKQTGTCISSLKDAITNTKKVGIHFIIIDIFLLI